MSDDNVDDRVSIGPIIGELQSIHFRKGEMSRVTLLFPDTEKDKIRELAKHFETILYTVIAVGKDKL